MKLHPANIQGLFLLETICFTDERGSFQKVFNVDFFDSHQLNGNFSEFYYSISYKHVIRGMHFQNPPYEHDKLVYVSRGKIMDVILDIRKKSPTFGKFCSFELNASDGKYLYIPTGCAHGFLSLEDDSIVNYAQTSVYSKEADCGIHYHSFGFDWGIESPIVSERDNNFLSFNNFNSPFES